MANNVNPREPEKKPGIWRSFWTLMTSVKAPWGWVGAATLVSLFGAQLSLMIPDATAKVATGDISMGAILFMVVCMFLSALEQAVSQILSRIASSKTEMNFQKLMLKKNLSLPMPFFDRNMASRLITRTTSDSTLVAEFFGWSIPYFPAALYRLVGVAIILNSYNWRLVALEAVMFPVILLVSFFSGRVGFTWNNRIQGKLSELGGYLAEILVNVPLVKVFVKEKVEEEKGKEAIEGIYKTKKKYLAFSSTISFLSSSESILQTVVVVLGGAALVNAGHITLEQWIAFYMYATNLVRLFQNIFRYYETIKRAQGSSRRMAEIIVEKSEDMGGGRTVPSQPGDLKFENVTFRYDTDTVLKNVSFTLPAGKTTALVGPSGAGKSTIFGLLERFYDPESGRVTLGGVDAKEFHKSSWRQAIGYVPQSSPLFSGTIRSNIVLREEGFTDEEIWSACQYVNADAFIGRLDQGLDEEVRERGGNFSAGQRQLLSFARTLAYDPAILVLDEATASIDTETESMITQALEKLMEGRTTIMVAHRLSTIQHADKIIVMHKGRIQESGTHQELLHTAGMYRKLYELQLIDT